MICDISDGLERRVLSGLNMIAQFVPVHVYHRVDILLGVFFVREMMLCSVFEVLRVLILLVCGFEGVFGEVH